MSEQPTVEVQEPMDEAAAERELLYAVREAIAAFRVSLALRRRGITDPQCGLVEAVADNLCAAAVVVGPVLDPAEVES